MPIRLGVDLFLSFHFFGLRLSRFAIGAKAVDLLADQGKGGTHGPAAWLAQCSELDLQYVLAVSECGVKDISFIRSSSEILLGGLSRFDPFATAAF
jgi:hypothetical protein